MTVRTITQLPEVSLGELKNSDNSLMEVSYSDSHGYSSRKAKIGNFKEYIVSNLSTELVNDYDLKDSKGDNISLSGLYDYSHKIVDQDGYFVGPKEIRSGCAWTQVDIRSEIKNHPSKYADNIDYILPNIGYVRQMINDEQKIYISTDDTKILNNNNNPFINDQPSYTAYENSGIGDPTGQKHLYFWKIDHNQKDSSTMYYDEMSWARPEYVSIADTGNLVVWGWLADQGEVDPEFAWVGLYGQLRYSQDSDTSKDTPSSTNTQIPWFPIQIKPWIRGENASTMQYVGFNVPVKKGLRLKIKTGFPVNGNVGGAKNSPGSLVFGDMDSCPPNSFFGYVIG